MNTSPPSFLPRSVLVMAGFALVAVACLALPAFGADAAPTAASAGTDVPVGPPPSVSVDVKKGEDKIAAGSSGQSGGGNRQPGGSVTSSNGGNGNRGGFNGGSSTMVNGSSTKAESRYIITVHNASKFAAKNLEVEYHIYNRTVSTHNGVSEKPELTPITEKMTVDSIDPGKSATLQTLMVPRENTQTQTVPTNVRSKPDSSSLVTDLLAWSVDVRFNGKVIAHKMSDNFDTRMKGYDTGR